MGGKRTMRRDIPENPADGTHNITILRPPTSNWPAEEKGIN